MNDTHERFGTYGAWLNPALGDAPRIAYASELDELGLADDLVSRRAFPATDRRHPVDGVDHILLDADGKIAYQRSYGVDSAAEVADLVREHLGVDL